MSVETDPSVMGNAATDAVAVLADSLGIDVAAGEAFDLWADQPAEMSELASKAAKAWTAPLIGPLGQCGELALVLPPGAQVPGEGRVASGLAGAVRALTASCGADHVGEMHRTEPGSLLQPRPGQRAVAVPMVREGAWAGALIVITDPAAAELPVLDPTPGPVAVNRSIADLSDVEMTVSVELGRTKIPIRDLLAIHNGSVVQLDRPVSHPVDIFVQGTLIARGEVVVVDEHFAVRVTELLTGD